MEVSAERSKVVSLADRSVEWMLYVFYRDLQVYVCVKMIKHVCVGGFGMILICMVL